MLVKMVHDQARCGCGCARGSLPMSVGVRLAGRIIGRVDVLVMPGAAWRPVLTHRTRRLRAGQAGRHADSRSQRRLALRPATSQTDKAKCSIG
jgi:hypothetical protein